MILIGSDFLRRHHVKEKGQINDEDFNKDKLERKYGI